MNKETLEERLKELKSHKIDVYSNSKNMKMENKRALQITKKIKKHEMWETEGKIKLLKELLKGVE